MDILEILNLSQKEAVLYNEGPLIIFAGAGTGKTRVITHKIAYLISQGISPYCILGMTFTNKAAGEMKNRVNNLVSNGAGASVHLSTFHSFCAYLLRIVATKVNLNPDFLIYDFSDQKNIVKECIQETQIDEKKFKPNTIVDKISRAKDDLKTASQFQEEADKENNIYALTIAKVYKLYQTKLERAGALDFGDLIMKVVEIFKKDGQILEHYQNKFKYILVDEYQDTNHAQYILTKQLAAKYKNITVVGDPDQSVYSWRGADINNILDFEKDYPGAKAIKLELNYRSTPKILSSAGKVIKNNSDRVEKKLWTQNPDDGILEVLKNNNENDEALKVSNIVSINSSSGRYNLSDFAVFYRTNAQSRVFEDAFRRSGIPYSIVGALKFYDRAEIKDITAYLKLVHNPNDNISLKRIINIPRRTIGKTTIETLEKEATRRGLSLWQTIPFAKDIGIGAKTVASLDAFVFLIKGFIKIKNTENVKNIVNLIVTMSGYRTELEQENTPETKAKIENIEELFSAIEDFQKRSDDNSLSGYLTQIALISDADDLDEDGNRGKVTLMTLHLAKGLEFENVFICGLEEGLFPFGDAFSNPKEIEEERRLMYVGMTRAKKNLYLSWASERMVYGKTKWNMMSRFIVEAGFKDEFTGLARQNNFGFDFQKQSYLPPSFSRGHRNRAEYVYRDENTDYIPDDSQYIKDDIPEETDPYQIGVIISHQVFGNGKIIDRTGAGADLKLVVLFNNGQWKKLLARVANLKII